MQQMDTQPSFVLQKHYVYVNNEVDNVLMKSFE